MADTTPAPAPAPVVAFKCKVPAEWQIEVADKDTITAYCPITLEKFEGTRADFNKALKA